MILSMTGFGKASIVYGNTRFEVTLRTLNSKQLELSMRTPHRYRDYENELRALLLPPMQRGRVDYTLTVTPLADGTKDQVERFFDEKRITGCYNALSILAEKLDIGINDLVLHRILAFPGVLKPLQEAEEEDSPSPEELEAIYEATRQAIEGLNEFRRQEGNMLASTLLKAASVIEDFRKEVIVLAPKRIEVLRSRIWEALERLPASIDVDRGRFEQELIYYIEKLDINEELSRLNNHLVYFARTIEEGNAEEPVGKKLGFIAQEMGREINTLGSKSNDSAMQHLVVEMKDALEQIKEQVANVL